MSCKQIYILIFSTHERQDLDLHENYADAQHWHKNRKQVQNIRLYCCRGVTVLLTGWVTWKLM
jgi:hypothetical protein